MGELETLIQDRIRTEGPLPFDRYMDIALYEPGLGYYGGGRTRSDWEGDFVTSPQIDPAFGQLWAEGVRRCWELAGRPERFDVIEIGPGEGGLSAGLQDALGEGGPFRYTLVEPIAALAERQRALIGDGDGTTWVTDVGEIPPAEHGVVLANEVLDNLPVALIAGTPEGTRELFVAVEAGRLTFVEAELRPITRENMSAAALRPSEGIRAEVPLGVPRFVRSLLSCIGKGAVIFIDYGAEGPALSALATGTLACYSPAGLDDDPLVAPGNKDITAHANWSAVRSAIEDEGGTPVGPLPQRTVLRALGARALDDRLRSDYEAAVEDKRGADGIRALSRRHALGALLDPGGLGGFDVMVGLKELSVPSFMTTG